MQQSGSRRLRPALLHEYQYAQDHLISTLPYERRVFSTGRCSLSLLHQLPATKEKYHQPTHQRGQERERAYQFCSSHRPRCFAVFESPLQQTDPGQKYPVRKSTRISNCIQLDPGGFIWISVDFLARFLLRSILHGFRGGTPPPTRSVRQPPNFGME